jgi:nitrogen fixation-related uncharacterized protein
VEVLILTVFVSVTLVAGGLTFFAWNVHHGTQDHSDRLSLLPLEEDARALAKLITDSRTKETD